MFDIYYNVQNSWLEIVPTFIVGLITAYIAYRQWITDKRLQKMKVFELTSENFYVKLVEYIEYLRKNNTTSEEQENDIKMLFTKYMLLFSKEDHERILKLFYEARQHAINNDTNQIDKIVECFSSINDIMRKYVSLDVKMIDLKK